MRTLVSWVLITVTACSVGLTAVWTYAAEPDIEFDEATAQKLVTLQDLLDRMEERIRTKILIPHAPFILGSSKEMQLRLLYELVRESGPDVKALEGEIKQAIELSREIERTLKRGNLDPAPRP